MLIDIEVETPQHIYDTQEVDDGEGHMVPRDVFAEIVDGDGDFAGACMSALWARYGERMINCCDVDRWIMNMKHKHQQIVERYAMKWTIMADADYSITDMATGHTVVTTDGKTEDLPDTAEGASEYPNARSHTVQDISNYDGTAIETVMQMQKGIDSLPMEDYAKEFEKLFLRIW